MSIIVSHYGSFKPESGAKPLRVQVNPKLPFGKPNPVNWMNGRHLHLGQDSEIGPHALEGSAHIDVAVMGLANGDILIWDGTNWLNKPFAHNLGSDYHPDIDLTDLADGDLLQWDAENKKWKRVSAVAQVVVTDLKWDLDSKCFMKKTRPIKCIVTDNESEWYLVADSQGVSHAELSHEGL
jgi:hypothetical protein